MSKNTALFFLYEKEIKAGLNKLSELFLSKNSNFLSRLGYIRSIYLPEDTIADGKQYYEGRYNNTDLNYPLHDPSVQNIAERAVSGMITYHLNPRDKYFSLTHLSYSSFRTKEISDDKAIKFRETDIHKILQAPNNFLAEASMERDKMIFGLGAKVIEDDDVAVAEINHYPPEDVMLGSTNGKTFDIFGVCEQLSEFAFSVRFEVEDDNDFQARRKEIAGSIGGSGELIKCYRINIKRNEFIKHMTNQNTAERGSNERKKYTKYLEILFPPLDKVKNPWIDIWFNDDGPITVRSKNFYNIIISQWGPSHMPFGIGKGQGDKAIPLAVMLAEMTDTNLTGYERTVAAPYIIPSEKTLFGSDFSRDGIIIANPTTGKGMPSVLSAGVDLRAAVEFSEYYLEKHRMMFFLDVFELIRKSRMTTVEVDRRGQDNFRRIGLFVVQDEATNLNPTVNAINHIIHNDIKDKGGKDDKVAQSLLVAQYSSALSYGHRNSVFEQTDRLTESLTRMAALQKQSPQFGNFLDFKGQADTLVKSSDQMDFLLDEEERAAKEEQEAKQMQNEMDLRKQQAAGVAMDNAKKQEEVNTMSAGQEQQTPKQT